MRPHDSEDDSGSGIDFGDRHPEPIPKHVWLAANADMHRRKREEREAARGDGRTTNVPRDRNGKRRRPTLEQKTSMFQTEKASWWQANARTPCEAAWRVPSYTVLLKEYAANGHGILEFPVTMPDGIPTMAIFRAEIRTVAGVRVRVLLDPITKTVYTGHEIK